jgi:hypothetical protein
MMVLIIGSFLLVLTLGFMLKSYVDNIKLRRSIADRRRVLKAELLAIKNAEH